MLAQLPSVVKHIACLEVAKHALHRVCRMHFVVRFLKLRYHVVYNICHVNTAEDLLSDNLLLEGPMVRQVRNMDRHCGPTFS